MRRIYNPENPLGTPNEETKPFKPIKGIREKIHEAFLRGDIIKKDGGASTRMQIIPRSEKKHHEVLSTQITNIGYRNGGKSEIPGAEFIPFRSIDDIIYGLVAEGFCVLSETVDSGIGQYHTRIFYLAGE